MIEKQITIEMETRDVHYDLCSFRNSHNLTSASRVRNWYRGIIYALLRYADLYVLLSMRRCNLFDQKRIRTAGKRRRVSYMTLFHFIKVSNAGGKINYTLTLKFASDCVYQHRSITRSA